MMSRAEIDVFLQRQDPAMLGVIGTLASDGWPNLVPIWYRWDGQAAHVWTGMERLWPQQLLSDPRVSLAVQEGERPFAAVLMKGRAELETDGAGHWDEVRSICRRYVPADEVDGYIEPWGSLRTIVTIRPERIVSWAVGY